MKLNKKEAAIEALGSPWAKRAKTLRNARDTHVKILKPKMLKAQYEGRGMDPSNQPAKRILA